MRRTVAVKLMPPLSFFLKPILGGCLLSRMPKPSSSCSISFLWPRGFNTSSTIRIRLQVRATETKGGGWHRQWLEQEVVKKEWLNLTSQIFCLKILFSQWKPTCDDLSASALAILGPLNDSREIQELKRKKQELKISNPLRTFLKKNEQVRKSCTWILAPL